MVDNSIDEVVAGYGKEIFVSLSKDLKSIKITDNGRGIPIEIHPKTKKSTLETIFTVLHSGGKFDHQIYQTSGGLHGVGLTAVNALSANLKVEVTRNEKSATQYFEEGVPKSFEVHNFISDKRGTSVEFTPDKKIFKDFSSFNESIIKNRLMELAYLNPGLTIGFAIMTDSGMTSKTVYNYLGLGN